MAMQLFLSMTGLQITYVPFKSGNVGLTDVLGGHIPVMMGSVLSALPHVRSGKLRPMGVTTAKRASGASDIPTIAEAGVPGYEAIQWFGVLAPAGTPRDIVAKLHGAIVKTLDDANVRKLLLGDGAEPAPSRSPEEYAAYLKADLAKWAKVIKESGMQLQ
jgi:tripartite-type tricarboxylate transporter receptor subunit TctC